MKSRAANFVAAIIASILYSASAFAAPDDTEPAEPRADTCLTSPREYTPPGTRWRYRMERETGRRCWFLKDEEKHAGKAPQQTVAAEEVPAPPRKKAEATRTLSDARAELSQAPAEPAKPSAARNAADPAAAALVAESSQPSASKSLNMLAPNTAARWPAPMSATAQATAPATAQANPAANSPASAAPPPEQNADVRPAATPPAKPQIMPRAVPPMPASEKPMSTPMLITIIAGGLSVFGVLVSLFFAWLAQRKAQRSPNAPMPPLEMPGQPRRPGDAYRERKRLRAQRSGRRAA
jgi:hypothetical protein